jgi:hypothetical protein
VRNVLISGDAAAHQAGMEVLAAGGNATDAVVAAMLAGAARASTASLLGSGMVLVAGPGVGAFVVDGRARAPGLGERRPTAPIDPPTSWRAAVPGLMDGALVAKNRFGSELALGTIIRTAAGAVREASGDTLTRARLKVLEQLPRTGASALARLGVHQAIMEAAGPAAGGVLTRDDLEHVPAPVHPLAVLPADSQDVLVAPPDPPVKHPAPSLPPVPVDAAVCADMHGVVACAVWAIAPEALPLATDTGLSLAALSNAPTKGVTRRRPGSLLPMPVPAAIVRQEGRAWAGIAISGEGDLEAARDTYLRTRLEAVGIPYAEGVPAASWVRGQLLWVVREAGDEVRGVSEAVKA